MILPILTLPLQMMGAMMGLGRCCGKSQQQPVNININNENNNENNNVNSNSSSSNGNTGVSYGSSRPLPHYRF